MDKKVVIDQSKCIGCGLCAKDCVGFDIKIVDKKAVAKGQSCIYCGHCEAICPQNAIKVEGFSDESVEFEEQTRLDPKTLMEAIKTRRTIRNYTSEPVSKEVLDLIIEAGRLAPTGANSQGTSYIILDKKKAECEAIAVKMFSRLINIGKKIIPAIKDMNIDEHFFFKNAPLVIIVLGKDKVSASLAAQNMAFMAEANGLGVLFSGFFTTCYNMNSKIRKVLNMKKKPQAVTTLVIGHPAVKYHRTIKRNPAKVIEA